MKRFATLVAVVAIMLAPSTALAQSSSTCQAYNPQLCNSVSSDQNEGTTTSAGTLPFTGLDVALLAVGGGGLLLAGVVVRRLSRRPD
jgi:hypothetical protein